MDQHECIVISDATSVQPLCRSRVDLSIIGLVAEAVEAEVAVGGVEEDLGICRRCPGHCSAVMQGFVVGAAPVSCTTPRLKQDKRDNVNLSGILIASPIHDIKYITTKC